MKRFVYLIISVLIQLIGMYCRDIEILEPNDLMYDAMTKANDFTKHYRILKKKITEQAIMVSLDSLGFNYVLQAKYIYDNEEVNAKQEHVFSSHVNHLFLTENFQRSPSTNKTLIQLYQQSTLIGYELRLTVVNNNLNKDVNEFEFQLTYTREEDIDFLEDGSTNKFLNMFSGDMEWRKVNFQLNRTEMMILTLENAFEIDMFMYSQQVGNITLAKRKAGKAPTPISKYSFKNAHTDQIIMILIRRTYNIDIANMPSIIDFNLSIISIYTQNNKLSLLHTQFTNFDIILPIFNLTKVLNIESQTQSDPQSNKFNIFRTNVNSNQTNSADTSTTQFKVTQEERQQKQKQKQKENKNQKEQEQEVDKDSDSNNLEQRDIEQSQDKIEEKRDVRLQLLQSVQEVLKNVIQYEMLVPIVDYSQPFYLGATSTSCNAYLKYQVISLGEEYSNRGLQLSEEESSHFSDKYSNIDMTGTTKILIQPSEFEQCQPNCQIKAILHIEILAEPSQDFDTFKLQGTQQINDLSNPAKPFFDYLPLLSYTFFKVEVTEDLNQLTIQYFSGYQLCYLKFAHSHIPPPEEQALNTTQISDKDKSLLTNQVAFTQNNNVHLNQAGFLQNNQLSRNLQENKKTEQYSENKKSEQLSPENNQRQQQAILEQNQIDERPILGNLALDTYYPSYQSGQMIVKPAKKGIHIFSALNISPMYSPFTIQVNSFNLRQMTNSSYISITLNGINDVQSIYYDKTFNKDNFIFLEFCSTLTDVTIYASTCQFSQNITSCPSPSKLQNSFMQIISSKNATIPDLCPNSMCHILFTIQYTPFTEFKSIEESNENSVKKFSVTLIESKDESSTQQQGKDPTNQNPSGKKSKDANNDSDKNSKWIIIACCILLAGIVIVSALMCYIKVKQNKIIREMNKQDSNGEDLEDELVDEEGNRQTNYSLSEYLMQERTTTNSTEQNVHQEQIYE